MAQGRIQFGIKDLQFIRDVLKDKSFSNIKWFDLGLKLKLLEPDLKAISSASNDASHCLRECLSLWLTKSENATPHLLVRSLESVDEAPAAQYARKILLDEANQLFLSYRDKLSKSFLTDDLVGLLRSEGVITKDTQEMIIDYGNKLEDEPFRAVCVTVADDHQKLKVLADVLLQSSETAPLGRELADKYCQLFSEVVSQTVSLQACQATTQQPVSEEEIYVSEAYKYDFDTARGDYGIFRDKIIPLLSSKIPVSHEELKDFLGHTYSELVPELTNARSIDAIIDIVGRRINIINIAMIETIVKRYDISEAKDLVTQYKKEIHKFTSDMKLKFALDKRLSLPISSLICETIKFVLDWEPSDHSLDDIRQLLKKAFDDSSIRVIVQSIHKGNSIIIICYAPRYLINVLLLEAQANLHVLKEENLIRLDVGHFTVYNEKEVMSLKEKLEQTTQGEKEKQRKALLLENEKLKSLLENKTRTQQNEEIKDEENVQPRAMKEGDTDTTQDSELISTSTESLEKKQILQYSDDVNTQCDNEDKEPQATTKTSDKEVQFNYLVPSEDNLDGLSDSHIAGKKLFLVQGDKPQLMDWEEYGLRISVPEGSLSSSETTEIAVIALVGGHFKFPTNTRLVSAVYAISASHLLKSLKLEVQHCVDLSDPSLCKYLKFVVAPVHTSSLPYQFSIVEGGEFPANSRYGSIERSKFCLLTVVLTGMPEAIIYAGQVSHANKNLMRFTAAKDLNALYRYIKKEYYHSEIDQRNILFKIDPSLGYVELIFDGPQSKPITGWSVHPHSEPCRIYEDEMLHEISSTYPPSCLISIDAENSSTTVSVLTYSVPLKGALNVTDLKPINIVIIRSLSDILSGEFPANSCYGSIERSKLGIVEEETNGGQGNGEQSTIIVPDYSTGIPEPRVYAGQVFYERKNLMRFIAAKDLNALRKYIKSEYCHSEIDEGFMFKLDPSLGYVELIFNSPQSKPITGWSVHPHMKPCRINEDEMLSFDGISNTHPPSRRVTIDVEDNPTTVRVLHYSVPLKGALNHKLQTMKIVILRSLKEILSAPAALPGSSVKSDPNIGKCAQDALKKHIEDLKNLLSRSEVTFRGIVGACREVKMISGTEYEEIFDGMTHQTLSKRVDQFLEGIISMLKHCPDQLDVFLSMLKEKGNMALIRVAERIAQSFNTEVPDQYHMILTES